MRAYAIITLDASGTIVTWNAGARDAFRYNANEVIGKPFDVLFTPDANGVLGFSKIARDLSGTKLQEARRDDALNRQKQAGLAAESAIRLKDEFLAIMSHELKHPLNLVHVNAELLTRMPEIDRFPGIRRAADTIQRAVAGQARIIDDLLDLSRARTGKMTMTLIPTSLRDIVVRIVEAARGDAAAKQVRYEWAVDPDDPLMVACDAAASNRCCGTCSAMRSSSARPGQRPCPTRATRTRGGAGSVR